MVFAVTGTGRVAQGILDVLELLPHQKIEPDDLKSHFESGNYDNKKVIISQFKAKDLVRKVTAEVDEPFDKKDYYENPQNYSGKFHEYLPYVKFLVNGVYWEAKLPRVLCAKDLKQYHEMGKSGLMGVCDISADYDGSIDFTRRFTSIEEPFICFDIMKDDFVEKINDANKDCILFHSVDHLPAEMPKEASNHFG
jgi:alpha-aminoadipic semialdehyde synthase